MKWTVSVISSDPPGKDDNDKDDNDKDDNDEKNIFMNYESSTLWNLEKRQYLPHY